MFVSEERRRQTKREALNRQVLLRKSKLFKSPSNASLASRQASTGDVAQMTGSEASWDNLLLTKNNVNPGRQNRRYSCLQIKKRGPTETSSFFMKKGKSELSL